MSTLINIMIIFIIILISYFLYQNLNKTNNHKEKNKRKNRRKKQKYLNISNNKSINNTDNNSINNSVSNIDFDTESDSDSLSCYKVKQLNRELLTIQYHKDYYDTITGINYLTSQKELFNLNFLPVKEIKPTNEIIHELSDLFISKLNHEIDNTVNEFNNPNSGWNDMGKQKRIKNGFEEAQEDLGLVGTIHNEGTKKQKVELIKIQDATQLNTDDQARIILTVVIQKPNTVDQMVLTVNFFMEREDMKKDRDDRENFFNKNLNPEITQLSEQDIIIEQIFIVGFLTNKGEAKTVMDNIHNYDNIRNADGTIDQEKVINAMIKKQNERSKELSSFYCSMSKEDKELHDVPSLGEYQSYKNTRTIIDDLKQFPQDSF